MRKIGADHQNSYTFYRKRPKILKKPQDHQYLLDIMPVYHNMQNQQNLMVQTQGNGTNSKFGQIWAHFAQFWAK